MPSQWVHARGQAHWVRGGVPGLSKGQGGRGVQKEALTLDRLSGGQVPAKLEQIINVIYYSMIVNIITFQQYDLFLNYA